MVFKVKRVIFSYTKTTTPTVHFLGDGLIPSQLIKVECNWLHPKTAIQFAQDLANQLNVPLEEKVGGQPV